MGEDVCFSEDKRLDCGTIELLPVKVKHISAVLLDSKRKDGAILSLVVATFLSQRQSDKSTKVANQKSSEGAGPASSTRWRWRGGATCCTRVPT